MKQYILTASFSNGFTVTDSFDTRNEAIKGAFNFFGLRAPESPSEEQSLELLKAVLKKAIGTFTITES